MFVPLASHSTVSVHVMPPLRLQDVCPSSISTRACIDATCTSRLLHYHGTTTLLQDAISHVAVEVHVAVQATHRQLRVQG